MWTEILAI